jgi:hypothetical protein
VLAVWTALFAPQLGGRVFVLGDAAAYRPFAEFSRERWLDSRERTFWNPYVFAGLAATASLADSRPQYLPDLVLDAIEWLTHLAGWPPLMLPLLCHLAGMFAMAVLARALWNAGPAAMVWAALAWGLMPNLLVPLAFGHDAQFVIAALIPLALVSVHRLFAARERASGIGAALMLGLVLGFQGLAGHPQFVAYSGALVIAFAIERWRRFGRASRLGLAALGIVLGAAISMAVWLPALLYSGQSVRAGIWGGVPLGEVARFSHQPRDLAALFWPWAVGFGDATYWGGLFRNDYPQYLGISLIALSVAAWPRRREESRSPAFLLYLLAALAVVLSLGPNLGPLYGLLHGLPVLAKFRVAVAILIVAQLALALLSARGVDRWIHTDPSTSSSPRWLGLGIAAAFVAILGLLVAFGPLAETYAQAAMDARPALAFADARALAGRAGWDLLIRGLVLGALTVLLALCGRAGWLGRAVPVALVLVLIADLASVSAPILRRATGPIAALEGPPPPPLARVAARNPEWRALPLERAGFLSNRWVSWRARSVTGEHGAINRYWDDLFSAGAVRHYAALCGLAVRYVATDASIRVDSAYADPVMEGDTVLPVLSLRGALPRAHAVPRVVAPGSDQAVIAGLFADDFDPARIAYTIDSAAAGDYPGSAACSLRWIEDLPDRLVLETESAERAFLVVADSYVPGWHARVDDRSTTLFRVNHMVRGVALPPGRHRVSMSYQPEGWRAGVMSTRLSLAVTILLCFGLGLAAIVRSRKRGAKETA